LDGILKGERRKGKEKRNKSLEEKKIKGREEAR